MTKYKVALDTSVLESGHKVRGIGVNTAELVSALQKVKDREIEVKAVDFTKVDLTQYDLAHYQVLNPYFLSLPLRKKTKTVITIHDFIYLIYPKAYPPGLKGRLIFLLQKILIKRVEGIITISETSKKDIIRFLQVPENKVYVVYLAAKSIFKPAKDDRILNQIKKKYHLPDRFILNVGGVNYNKNLITLAKACEKVGIDLVLVGKSTTSLDFNKNHPENKPFAKFLDKYGNDPRVHRLGFVADNELTVVFSLATAYCQPSFYEGFSLGVLEAQAAGVAVIASKINVHQEIAGDSVLYFEPLNSSDLSDKIEKLLKDEKLRAELSQKGLTNVKRFSWQKTANETIKIYKRILERA